MTRQDKEYAYMLYELKVQKGWGNPLEYDWSHVQEMTDEELDKELERARGQYRFEARGKYMYVGFVILVSVLVGWFFGRLFD